GVAERGLAPRPRRSVPVKSATARCLSPFCDGPTEGHAEKGTGSEPQAFGAREKRDGSVPVPFLRRSNRGAPLKRGLAPCGRISWHIRVFPARSQSPFQLRLRFDRRYFPLSFTVVSLSSGDVSSTRFLNSTCWASLLECSCR